MSKSTLISSENNFSWISFMLGGVALCCMLYSIAAPAMWDGIMATPSFIFHLSSALSFQQPVTEPTFTAVPYFLLTDNNKRFLFAVLSIALALMSLLAACLSMLRRQHSLGYASGILASATALSLIHPVAFFGFVFAAGTTLILKPNDSEHV